MRERENNAKFDRQGGGYELRYVSLNFKMFTTIIAFLIIADIYLGIYSSQYFVEINFSNPVNG